MTALDLDAITKREQAATPPTGGDTRWHYEHDISGRWLLATGADPFHRDNRGKHDAEDFGFWLEEADAAFVAHAREDIPALVAEVKRQAAIISEARKVFAMQCTEDEPERDAYIDDGAYFAHRWWWTVLGPVLREPSPSQSTPLQTGNPT